MRTLSHVISVTGMGVGLLPILSSRYSRTCLLISFFAIGSINRICVRL